MNSSISILSKTPTPAEYENLITAVGWRPRDLAAIEIALSNSLYAVCAESDGQIIGCGRVIGDGGMHFYLTDVLVHPSHQRQGIGTMIVAALTRYIESIPYKNVLVAVLPTPGSSTFYANHGYKPQGPESPIMQRWINPLRSESSTE